MFIPVIEDYKDFKLFLKDFISKNKTLDEKYSHRYFSNRLSWPDSLISDLISGRRSLTIKRCFELANLLNFNDYQTEYLLCLCLSESKNTSIRAFFERTMNTRVRGKFFTFEEKHSSTSEFELIAIYEYLKLRGKLTSAKSIADDLPYLNLSQEEVEETIKTLVNQNFINIDKSTKQIVFNTKNLTMGYKLKDKKDVIMKVFTKSTTNIRSFLSLPIGKNFTVNTGFAGIHMDDYKEVEARFLALRNWLIEIEKKSQHTNNENKVLFQYDINFFPISIAKK